MPSFRTLVAPDTDPDVWRLPAHLVTYHADDCDNPVTWMLFDRDPGDHLDKTETDLVYLVEAGIPYAKAITDEMVEAYAVLQMTRCLRGYVKPEVAAVARQTALEAQVKANRRRLKTMRETARWGSRKPARMRVDTRSQGHDWIDENRNRKVRPK